MADWQPIDTAPKDGTHILVFSEPESPPVVAAYFELCDGEVFCLYADEALSDISPGGIVDPSHWMLLPEPPQNEEQL